MADDPKAILSDAVGRNVGVILSLPSAGMWRHHKSRFLGESAEGLWIESAPRDAGLIEDLIGHQQPAAVSFKTATGKTSFVAQVIRREPNYRVNSQVTAEALLVRWPHSLKSVQRRTEHRVRITPDTEIAARVWLIGEQAELNDEPMPSLQLAIQLRDLSVGGIGLYLDTGGANASASTMAENMRMRIEIKYESDVLILDGRLRHQPKNLPRGASKLRVGVKFEDLESGLDGRQALATLQRIVGDLQREETRRARLGLAEAG